MGNIGESLQRKLGPLPVWAWALLGGVILYVIRARGSSSSGKVGTMNDPAATAAEASLITAEGQASAATMQTPQILAPGESVYDPNSGLLQYGGHNNAQSNALIDLIAALLLPQPGPRRQHHRIHHHGRRTRKHIHGHHHDHPGHHPGKHPGHDHRQSNPKKGSHK